MCQTLEDIWTRPPKFLRQWLYYQDKRSDCSTMKQRSRKDWKKKNTGWERERDYIASSLYFLNNPT